MSACFKAFKTDANFNEYTCDSNIAIVDLISAQKNVEKIKINDITQAEICAIEKAIDSCLKDDFVLVCNDNQAAVEHMRQKYNENSRIQILWLPSGFNQIADALTRNKKESIEISLLDAGLSQIKNIKLKLKNNEKIGVNELRLLKNEIDNIKKSKDKLSSKNSKKFKKLKKSFKDICQKIVENSLNEQNTNKPLKEIPKNKTQETTIKDPFEIKIDEVNKIIDEMKKKF